MPVPSPCYRPGLGLDQRQRHLQPRLAGSPVLEVEAYFTGAHLPMAAYKTLLRQSRAVHLPFKCLYCIFVQYKHLITLNLSTIKEVQHNASDDDATFERQRPMAGTRDDDYQGAV
jgi:hypothetical protein